MRKYNRIFSDRPGFSRNRGDGGFEKFGGCRCQYLPATSGRVRGGLEIPNLRRLGMGNLCGVTEDEAKGYARRLNEASNGKTP